MDQPTGGTPGMMSPNTSFSSSVSVASSSAEVVARNMTWREDTKSSVAISTGGDELMFMKVTIVPFIK